MSKPEQGNPEGANIDNQERAGKPRQELIVQTNTLPQEQSGLPAQQDWFGEGMPHEQLVDGLRGFIEERGRLLGGAYSPEEIIRRKLQLESGVQPFQDERRNEERRAFFSQLRTAWDGLAYERYEAGSLAEQLAGATLSHYYQHTRAVGEEPVIKLTPGEVRAIDALTEAVGIPHQKGQTRIEIADKHRNRTKWVLSQEYQNRVAQAKAKPGK